jgi:hypothetical protein
MGEPEGVGGSKFCDICQYLVIDFTKLTQKEFDNAVRNSPGRLCGRFKQSQMSPRFLRYAAVTAVATSLLAPASLTQEDALLSEDQTPPPQKLLDEKEFYMITRIASMKILYTCCVMICVIFCSHAQPTFGVKAAIGINNLHGDNPYFKTAGKTMGWTAGVYSKIKLRNTFSFIPELQIAKREYDISGFNGPVQVSCLQLNALMSYAPVRLIAFDIGSYFSQRVNITSHFFQKEYAKMAFNREGELGFIAGLRINFTKSLSVTSRYALAVTPIATADLRDDQNRMLGTFTQYWRGVEFGLVYQIIKLK